MTTQALDAETYLERLLMRFGQPVAVRYRTGIVAKVLGISREAVRQRIHRGRIAAVRDGAHHYVSYRELVRLVVQESDFLR